ncbi:hydroxysqualene dehydroxylase [Legionella sp. CNM-1927-20]|uniref:hydroxysqualene dehydroxylase n=1 Tax=Legionella sp. CNM-1927-20 TaxID=3422221 RepID=UPI00403AE73C
MIQDVIIIGGGLSGLSAAIECLEKEKTVLILEAREVLGGRTSSWQENGMTVESGLHRVIGTYTHFPQLLKKAGLKYNKIVIWEDEIEFRIPEGLSAVYGFAPIFRFKQTLKSALGNNHYLNWKDKIKFSIFMLVGFIRYWFKLGHLDAITILDYAKKHRLSDKCIQRLLVPLTEGIFFLPPQDYSAYAFFGLFSPVALRWPWIRAGAFTGGMSDILIEPLAKKIEEKGGIIKRGTPVEKILVENGKIVGVVQGQEEIRAKNVILATSLLPAKEIISQSLLNYPFFRKVLELPTLPTVTIQLELEKPAMSVDHATFAPGTLLSSFSEQSRTTFSSTTGRLSIILAQTEESIKKTPDELLAAVLEDMKKINLNVSHVKNFHVTYQQADFYRMAPHVEQLKPSQKTPIEGFALAGDYTKQKYFTTMEGAVYSGKLAVKALKL